MGFRKPIKKIHSQLAAVAYDRLDELYFSYLGNYKIAIIIFNLAPYVAFKVMAQVCQATKLFFVAAEEEKVKVLY